MPCSKLKEFLDSRGMKYVTIQHSPAYTATEVAESAHVSGSDFAKTVIVKIEGEMAMAVLPANRKIALAELRDMLGSDTVELASEHEFMHRFPDCELGAMPPFGNLYGFPVYLDTTLAGHDELAFNAGSHREAIKMKTRDFVHVVNPMVMDVVSTGS